MASLADHEKVNGARLSRLLIDKGTEAMRLVFDSIHPPVSLTATLNSYYSFLKNKPFINSSQMSTLFPPSGIASQSRDFDITLLFILLRNICGLHPPPSTGSWDTNPPSWDKTREANLARIKYYRNKVYGHITTTGVNDTDFHSYWNDISTAVVDLGVDEGDVKFLQFSPLDESLYIRQLIEWKKQEDQVDVRLKEIEKNLKEMFHSLESGHHRQEAIQEDLKVVVGYHKELKEDVQELKSKPELQQQPNILQHLAKCEFKSNIECLNNSFHSNTRKWLLKKLDCWFQNNDSDSQVMVLTAGPGVGKSVFAAKVCTIYKEKAQLAACHFCKFNFSDYSNPHKMMQSLAMHMCENVPGFRERLIEQLQRAHSKESITDAFRVLLKDPLDSLPEEKPLLLVIDGLDESEMDGKSELLDLIAKEFPLLPKWLKIFITSRPELPVRKKLDHLNPIEILPDDEDNKADLRCYLRACLTYHKKLDEYELDKLVEKCEGSFLYAHYCQLELNRLPPNTDIAAFAPKGISSVYEDYFTRLEKELKELSPNIQFDRILGVLVVMKGPLPLSFIAEILELPGDNRSTRKVIQKVNESLSALLLVYDDCLTVFHKSVVDWIMCIGYEQHSFSIQNGEFISGHKYLWEACQKRLLGWKEEKSKNVYASNHAYKHLSEITLQPPPSTFIKSQGWNMVLQEAIIKNPGKIL